MLTITCGTGRTDCQGTSRRDFLRAGFLGLGGLSLPWLLEQKAQASTAANGYVRDKAVILIFCAGGISNIESFNPNMDGPEPSRSMTGEVQTSLPGVTFG